MPLTLKDIARMVGVAESTVSRAINNKPGVGEETRQKIKEIVKKYNYRPNQLAQGLAKQETHLLALLLSDLNTPGYVKIVKKIEEIANKEGYQVILCNIDNDTEKEKAYLELVSRNQVDGAIIIGGGLIDRSVLNLALDKKNKIVLVNSMAEEILIPTVMIDNARGGYLAAGHLLDQGYKKIAIVMGSGQDFLESEKLTGYTNALKEHGFKVDKDLIKETNGSREGGYEAFLQMMELEELPRAFFTTNDLLAVGVSEAIKMGGYLIPDDFALVCYGETLLTSIVDPPLTVIAEPLEEMGILAAEYLIKLIKDQNLEDLISVLEPVLIERDSTILQFK